MNLSRRNIGKTAIISFILLYFLPLLITASITDIYSCADKANAAVSCAALDSAHWKIQLGIALQLITAAIFIASFVTYIVMRVRKKDTLAHK
jgi:uncharacterized membrane protein